MKITIISEDSSKQAPDTLKNIIVKSLFHIEANLNNDPEFLEIKYNSVYKKIFNGNLWKDTKQPYPFEEFCRYIADIYTQDDQFLFWHIDADIIWKDGAKPMDSANISQWLSIIPPTVEKFCTAKPFNLSDFLQKIILVVPFYSLESWLYENYEKLNESNQEAFRALKKLREDNGNKFDVIFKIKDSNPIGDSENLRLSNYFSSKKVHQQDLSYSLYFTNLSANNLLKTLLPTRFKKIL